MAAEVKSGVKVIGAGWGRTGTLTLTVALEVLGYSKCATARPARLIILVAHCVECRVYHMTEIGGAQWHALTWSRAADGDLSGLWPLLAEYAGNDV
jgi:hypothetical protein